MSKNQRKLMINYPKIMQKGEPKSMNNPPTLGRACQNPVKGEVYLPLPPPHGAPRRQSLRPIRLFALYTEMWGGGCKWLTCLQDL